MIDLIIIGTIFAGSGIIDYVIFCALCSIISEHFGLIVDKDLFTAIQYFLFVSIVILTFGWRHKHLENVFFGRI